MITPLPTLAHSVVRTLLSCCNNMLIQSPASSKALHSVRWCMDLFMVFWSVGNGILFVAPCPHNAGEKCACLLCQRFLVDTTPNAFRNFGVLIDLCQLDPLDLSYPAVVNCMFLRSAEARGCCEPAGLVHVQCLVLCHCHWIR